MESLSFGQSASANFKLWRLMSYSGNIGVRGFYRQQERTLGNVIDYSKNPFIQGRFALNAKSYIAHPNLLLLEVGGEYNPGTTYQNYTVSPDRSEVLTLTKLDLRATLFNTKPMSLVAYLNLNQNFINREYVTSLKTNTKQWGVNYYFRNKILPLTVRYNDRRWYQLELETGRTFRNIQSDFQAQVRRSFTKNGDNNELRYTRYNFVREDYNAFQTHNLYDNLILSNFYYLDGRKKYSIRSRISGFDQQGSLTQERLQSFQNLNLNLPYNLRFSGNYDYANVRQLSQRYKQNRINLSLDHQLFASLRTGIFYEFQKTNHSSYNESNTRIGGTLNYQKKIPKGTLNLIYSFSRQNQNVVSNPDSIITIIDEDHVLADDQVVLLNRPYIYLSSVIVKDISGSIIYQENFDYILIERDEFVEIQRIPGGQIANNSPILVDYQAEQIGSYNFNVDMQSFSIRVTLFDRLLEMYYTIANQDYNNVESADFLILNYFTRNIYGVRFHLGLLTAGVERDDYKSTIVPYEKMRYFLQLNGKIGKKILLSLNGDLSYLTLTETNTDQLYSNLYGKVVYLVKPRSKINFDIGYRKQIGKEIDLDLVTARAEFNTIYRNLYMKAGLEMYRRNYVGEQLNFKGIYFQIDRKF